jgi:hypothetical protein
MTRCVITSVIFAITSLRPTPLLPGISAFGTRMAFYEYVATTNILTPHAISPDPVSLNDVAPAKRWSCVRH